jgi:nucleotide-binding universal stress UspA family protein
MKNLIAIDDSACSETVVESVLSGYWPAGSLFNLITIVEPLNIQYALSGALYYDAIAEAQTDFNNQRRKFLNEKAEQLNKKFGENKVASRIIDGDVVTSIIDEALEWDADLIILGSHGRSGFQKLLLGSVADKVVSRSPCSVQIIKPKLTKERSITNAISTQSVVA